MKDFYEMLTARCRESNSSKKPDEYILHHDGCSLVAKIREVVLMFPPMKCKEVCAMMHQINMSSISFYVLRSRCSLELKTSRILKEKTKGLSMHGARGCARLNVIVPFEHLLKK